MDRQYPIKNIKVHFEDVVSDLIDTHWGVWMRIELITMPLLQVEGIEVTYRLANGNESDSSWAIMLGSERVNPGIINLDRTCRVA